MASKKITLVASLFGNALEWYDFILYANFAPIIAALFFPTKDPVVSLILTFAVFASGFLVRPFGAILFGYIGDHLGRRIALITSICIITVPTILIGFIPTYATVGIAAPIILTLLRLLQGIAVSGELNSATTYLVEHVADNRRGFAGSLVMATAFLGILIGAVLSFVMAEAMSNTVLYEWGWRIPFWLGGLAGIVGILIRLRAEESPKFLETAKEDRRAPLRTVFSHHYKKILLSIGLTSIMAVANYIFVAFMVTFLVNYQGFSLKIANQINLISMFVMLLLFPVMGILSDKYGRKPIFKIGLFGFFIFSVPIFWLLTQKSFAYALAGDILFCLVLVPIAALVPTLLAELFPTNIRNSGAALGYNLCLATFGGTAPLVALQLVHVTGSQLSPAYYLMACAAMSFAALYFIKEGYRTALK